MKIRFLILLATILLSSLAGAQTYDTNFLTNGLVAQWLLNGNANDSVGINGGISANVTWTNVTSISKSNIICGYFNGYSSIKVLPNPALNVGSNGITLSLNIKVDNTISNYDAMEVIFGGGQTLISDCSYRLEILSTNSIQAGMNGSYNWGNNWIKTPDLTAWNNITYTYNYTNALIYVNGRLINNTNTLVSLLPNAVNTALYIGSRDIPEYANNNSWFRGCISDVRIYNRALSSNEVASLYAMESTPPAPPTTTDTFGSGTNQFGIDFVTIGNPGNSNDTTGYGGVPYTYRIGKYTISQNQIDVATRNGLQNVTAGAWGGDQPAANISWYEAAAYVNWLNTSQGYRPAYNLTFTNGAWSMALWPTSPDINGNVAWTLGGTNLFRNALCHYFLPSENEWYKAAYYDPNKNRGSGRYWLYPTGNDTAPTPVTSGTIAGTAIYNQGALILPQTGPASVFEAGGLSPYGTMGQGGNVFQWIESFNFYNSGLWGIRGGLWWSSYYDLESIARNYNGYGYNPKYKGNYIGFRVASMDDSGPTNNQSINFPAIPTLTLTNGAYTLGATASSGLPVSYSIGDTTVAGITNGTLIPLGVGTTTVVATQAGETNYLPATPVTNTLVVTLAQQTVIPTTVASRTYGSLPFGLTLPTNASGLPITARIVSGPATLSGTNLILTGSGTVTLAYEAPGNDLYAAASVTNSFMVTNGPTNLKSQTITFKALAAKAYGSAPQALTGSASSKLPVTFWSSNTNVAVINGTNAVITGAGSTVITAYQPGDGSTFNPATPVSQTLLVNQSSQKLTLKAPKSVAYGSTPTAITANSSAGLPVTLTSSDTSIATITNSGTNSLLVPTGVGTITLTATQAGNTNVGAAIPVGQAIVISPGIQTITFAALGTNTYGASPMTLTATSSAGLPVSFTSSATNVAAISGNTLTIMGAGSAKITASHAGSRLWAPAKAVTQSLTVAKASQTISFTPPSTVRFTNGGLVTLGATASSGLPIAYKSGNTKVLSITGSTCVITGRGTSTVVASQPGGANYLPAPSVTNTITVQ